MAAYNGKIYAVGGSDGVYALCSVEVYDPVENRWTFGKPMCIARANVGVAVIGKRLYAVGGFNGKTFLNTIEYFDFETEEWTTSVAIDKTEKPTVQSSNGTVKTNGAIGKASLNGIENGVNNIEIANENGFSSSTRNGSLNGKVQHKNSLSSEPLVEVEETIVGH